MKYFSSLKNILGIVLLLETLCVTYALYFPSLAGYTSLLYTFSGLVIGLCMLWIKYTPVAGPYFFSFQSPVVRYKWILMGVALIFMRYCSLKWIEDAPLNYQDADMLPIIKTMCERAISGNWLKVYDPIPEIWGGTHPIYLPAMWLPFCLPLILHLDIRCLTLVCLMIPTCIIIWRSNAYHRHAFPVIISTFILIWWLFTDDKAGLVPYTEEGVVIMFYVLLVFAIKSHNTLLIGIAASLCVLSRYALVGWLPAMLLFFVLQKDWKKLIVFIATGLICFVLLVLLPFGWGIFSHLLTLPSAYIDFSARVWHDASHVFRESLGWAKFFGPQRIALLHYLLIGCSLSVPLIFMMAAYRLQKKNNYYLKSIPMATLKITLVVFYTLIDVPYLYLFYTSSFVSIIAIGRYMMSDPVNMLPAETGETAI